MRRISVKTRWAALLLCMGLLLSATGCAEDTPPVSETTPTTTAAAAATTVSTTAETTATIETTAATITAAKPTTAPTTLPPTTTKAPTTAKPVTNEKQFGKNRFVLDGNIFAVGVSPEKLLSYLGTPSKTTDEPDVADGHMFHYYYYDDLVVVTTVPVGKSETVISAVYFITDRYTFDDVAVGDTADEVYQKLSPNNSLQKGRHIFSTLYGGVCYENYNEIDKAAWSIFFPEPDEPFINGEVNILPESRVSCIKIHYLEVR